MKVFSKSYLQNTKIYFTFDDSLIPDLSAFSKEELVHQLFAVAIERFGTFLQRQNKIWQTKNSQTIETTEEAEEIVIEIEEEIETEVTDLDLNVVVIETEVENQNVETKYDSVFSLISVERDQLKTMDMLEHH